MAEVQRTICLHCKKLNVDLEWAMESKKEKGAFIGFCHFCIAMEPIKEMFNDIIGNVNLWFNFDKLQKDMLRDYANMKMNMKKISSE